MFTKLKKKYQHYERLPSAAVPPEMAPYLVQHRFREKKEEYPLVQMGPGIISVNETSEYERGDFDDRILEAVYAAQEIYHQAGNDLEFNTLVMRYVNAVRVNLQTEDVITFLEHKMHTNVNLSPEFFKEFDDENHKKYQIEKPPLDFDWRLSLALSRPKGILGLRFWKTKKDDYDSLLWETIIQSSAEDFGTDPELDVWLKEAHHVADRCCHILTAGDLYDQFK
jgi:uncharacterized protein (TIGR04255 family)